MSEQAKPKLSTSEQIALMGAALAFITALFLVAGGYMDWAILLMLAALVLKPNK